jgi:hypothetical protein
VIIEPFINQVQGAVNVLPLCICLIPENRYSRCNCSKLDTLLGQALKSLVNLQVLHINCACCRVLSDVFSRHTYLEKLRTTELRELSFQCRCLPYDQEPYRALTAPYMSSIKTLRWELFWKRDFDPPYRAFLKTHRCLSQISRLLCDDYELVSPVINRGVLFHYPHGEALLRSSHRVTNSCKRGSSTQLTRRN